MVRKINIVGGGSQTNKNGLEFEERTHLIDALNANPNFTVNEDEILKEGKIIAYYYEKHKLYKNFLLPNGIDYRKVISKQLLPDGVIIVGKTAYIIEKKFQNGGGSVDEKIQTCDFKKKQYAKLFDPLVMKVEFYYVLSNWFNNPKNQDVFDYIKSVGCDYFFEELPLNRIGLQ